MPRKTKTTGHPAKGIHRICELETSARTDRIKQSSAAERSPKRLSRKSRNKAITLLFAVEAARALGQQVPSLQREVQDVGEIAGESAASPNAPVDIKRAFLIVLTGGLGRPETNTA